MKIGDCTVQRLLFTHDFVLLDSTQNGLQRALDWFSDACSVARMKISTTKAETMRVSREPKQCSLQTGLAPLNESQKLGISASHSQMMANEIMNWISAVEKQVQECASFTDLWC